LESREIREIFISFFERREHRVVPGSSLIPADPTLLLTNAGMVQFKPYFLGEEEPPYRRATSVQKCLRTTDIESVGRTARHNTFFEMLGNFSFGDYYKESVIPWAWELLTGELAIDPGTLWISVYEADGEAERIWREAAGVSAERIISLGADDNFWDMGATGPCGPCSEILYDRGAGFACGPQCAPGCDCDRYLELWNLVFMQYNREADGTLAPLPMKNIDTGMGLERVAAIKQGVQTIFETDLIKPVLDCITDLSGVSLGDSPVTDISVKVIADHARAAAFLISDGVIPANEGRGYILRRILRRAVRHGRLLEIGEYFIDRLSEVVIELLGGVYPGLKEHRSLIKGVVSGEEERFGQTLEQGLDLLRDVIGEHRSEGKDAIDGKTVFYLHDTLGFPLEVTSEIASDEGMNVDRDGFNALMEEQKARGRLSREAGEEEAAACDAFDGVCREKGETVFEGYETFLCASSVVAIVVDGERVDVAEGDREVEVVLDRTSFYAESGGQVGDTGMIRAIAGSVEVEATYYGAPGLVVHRGRLTGTIKNGDTVDAAINPGPRMDTSRNHSATHILHWALREVLGSHAKQSGSLVTPERLRFDFTHFKPVSAGELEEVERLANSRVLEDVPVSTLITGREEALSQGAIALFGEKYASRVRVVRIGEFSQELCGGAHVVSSGQIGPIKIISESGIGAGLRRIEATSGWGTLEYFKRLELMLEGTARLLKVEAEQVPGRVDDLLSRMKELEREWERQKSKSIAGRVEEIIREGRDVEIGGARVLLGRVDGEDQKVLRDVADMIMGWGEFGVVALVGENRGSAQLVVKVNQELVGRSLSARDLALAGGQPLGGGGGGRDDMAVAGGGLTEGLEQSLVEVENEISRRIGGAA